MAGTQPNLQNSTAATSGLVAGARGSARRPAQVLFGLMDAWAMLLATIVTSENQDRHNAEVTKLRDQIT